MANLTYQELKERKLFRLLKVILGFLILCVISITVFIGYIETTDTSTIIDVDNSYFVCTRGDKMYKASDLGVVSISRYSNYIEPESAVKDICKTSEEIIYDSFVPDVDFNPLNYGGVKLKSYYTTVFNYKTDFKTIIQNVAITIIILGVELLFFFILFTCVVYIFTGKFYKLKNQN